MSSPYSKYQDKKLAEKTATGVKYSVNINKRKFANNSGGELKTWKEVTNILKNGLSFDTIEVEIFKYSGKNKLVCSRKVTMGNLFEVANAKTDKVLKYH